MSARRTTVHIKPTAPEQHAPRPVPVASAIPATLLSLNQWPWLAWGHIPVMHHRCHTYIFDPNNCHVHLSMLHPSSQARFIPTAPWIMHQQRINKWQMAMCHGAAATRPEPRADAAAVVMPQALCTGQQTSTSKTAPRPPVCQQSSLQSNTKPGSRVPAQSLTQCANLHTQVRRCTRANETLTQHPRPQPSNVYTGMTLGTPRCSCCKACVPAAVWLGAGTQRRAETRRTHISTKNGPKQTIMPAN